MSRLVATLAGIGNLKPAPGTWGSAAAVALAWPIHALGGFPALACATLVAFAVGWWSVAEATRGSLDHDPSEIVIDELVGQWIALWPLSAGLWFAGVKGWTFPWPGWVAAFVLFRLFDIWKPGPVGRMDRRADVAGTMLDDVVAGAMAAVCVGVLGWLAHEVLREVTAEDVIARAGAAGVRLAAAESCTGGLLMGALTEVAGASDVVDRGFVTYSNAAKREMLGVREATLARRGAVSRQTAEEMASGALARSTAGIAVAVTGIAGPGGSEHKPEGRVCFALASPSGVESETVEFGAPGRGEVRARSVAHALELLARALPPVP